MLDVKSAVSTASGNLQYDEKYRTARTAVTLEHKSIDIEILILNSPFIAKNDATYNGPNNRS